MGGLLRNALTLLLALLSRERKSPDQTLSAGFLVTPLDVGIAKLKSDRYLRLTEAAQIDFLARTGVFARLVRHRYAFVNTSVLIRFSAPVTLFSWMRIESRVVYHDARVSYLEHVFLSGPTRCACVLVKMKFKQGHRTIDPAELFGNAGAPHKPAFLQAWDDTLAHSWP
ncbi:thioesterase family protein [Pseudomonas knackmussii]|uniref:Thioesterase family protein n=1 Tax=Pseudomonas knackmussii TaxID=65741 RepID=A0ABY4KS85_9PSED|nr:thioesterase family protein [Pseudomonas knackmussii]UPQ83690.1 thioesterase family protein [Pseudomonas knackmussii]